MYNPSLHNPAIWFQIDQLAVKSPSHGAQIHLILDLEPEISTRWRCSPSFHTTTLYNTVEQTSVSPSRICWTRSINTAVAFWGSCNVVQSCFQEFCSQSTCRWQPSYIHQLLRILTGFQYLKISTSHPLLTFQRCPCRQCWPPHPNWRTQLWRPPLQHWHLAAGMSNQHHQHDLSLVRVRPTWRHENCRMQQPKFMCKCSAAKYVLHTEHVGCLEAHIIDPSRELHDSMFVHLETKYEEEVKSSA